MPNFNEFKARKLTKTLLEQDVKKYKKFIPDINSMNSESFEKLFTGDNDYNYNIENRDFKELGKKFNNYHTIIEEWYENEDDYLYIKELWSPYICIEELGEKEENEIEEYLMKNKINLKKWP